jgi:Glycogen recognition site of AMP-activated protein kinase
MLCRREIARLTALAMLVSMLAGCSLLSFIQDRLPPPQASTTGMVFRYKATAARQVNLAGDFNNWLGTANGGRLDPNLDPMTDPHGEGIWEITLPLPPGRYQYKFLIDQVDWQEDPGNPETTDDGFGGKNSILVIATDPGYPYDENFISYSLGTGSRISVQQDHDFTLAGFEDAEHVYLTGSFAGWSAQAIEMERDANGNWHARVKLESGRHLYKFVVDGNWIADPANDAVEDDGLGGSNSVLEIDF